MVDGGGCPAYRLRWSKPSQDELVPDIRLSRHPSVPDIRLSRHPPLTDIRLSRHPPLRACCCSAV